MLVGLQSIEEISTPILDSILHGSRETDFLELSRSFCRRITGLTTNRFYYPEYMINILTSIMLVKRELQSSRTIGSPRLLYIDLGSNGVLGRRAGATVCELGCQK